MRSVYVSGNSGVRAALGSASMESLGNTRWIVNAYLSLAHFKTVQLLRDLVDAIREGSVGPSEKADYDRTYPTLMSRMIATTVPYGNDAYRVAQHNFRENLDDFLDRITAAGVRVLASELISNIRDMPPFVSVETDEHPAASTVFEQARELEREEKYDEARTAYYRAKDLDTLRFRAPEDFNEIIHQVAGKHGVPVVPMKAYFEAASPHGLIGDNLMLEHLHPNVDGYFLIADAFFETIRQNGFIEKEWDSTRIKSAAYYAENWPVTELDRALGRLRAMDLMDYWPFRPRSDPGNSFATYQPVSPADEAAYLVASDKLDFVQAHINLGDTYTEAGQPDKALREYQAVTASKPFGAR